MSNQIRKKPHSKPATFSLWKFKKKHKTMGGTHTTHHFLPLLGKSHQH